MQADIIHDRIEHWLEDLLADGKSSFSLESVGREFDHLSAIAVKRSLNRLSRKGKIVSVHKGFYVIVTPQYRSSGVLPPVLFIDDLMRHLGREYYVGLLSAAAFHGAAHQAPQEFFVVTTLPQMRSAVKKGLKINYLSRPAIPSALLESRKTDTGFVKVASPELTAADLIQYNGRIGGINRASEVISELTESIDSARFDKAFVTSVPAAVTQRLGFILESVIGSIELAEALFWSASESEVNFFPVPLSTKAEKGRRRPETRWKIIVNENIEVES